MTKPIHIGLDRKIDRLKAIVADRNASDAERLTAQRVMRKLMKRRDQLKGVPQ